jgi:predicted membrane-bound spermidine synthase
MPEPPFNTLAQLIAFDVPVAVTCAACGRAVELHLPTLAARYGGNTPILNLAPKFKCVFCGGPGSLRIGAPRR